MQHDLSIIFDEETFQKEMLNPFYKDHSIIDDDIILIEKYKESIQLNRPVQISAAILELAKAEMYRYWYKGEIGIEYNIPALASLYLHCNYIISIKNKASLDFESWRNVFSDVWLTISLEFVFWRMRGRVGGPNNANVDSRVLMYPLDTGHGVY